MRTDKNINNNIQNLDRWLWLLYRTIQENNWQNTHPRFSTDNSFFRELSDILHFIEDLTNKVPLNNPVKQNINNNIGVLKIFREYFAIDCYKKGFANKADVRLIISMINRTIHFREFNVELMDLVKDSFNEWKKNSQIYDLDQAFQLKHVYDGVPPNPYEVPYNITRLVEMMIDDDLSLTKSMDILNKEASNHLLKTNDNKGLWRTANDKRRPSIWEERRWVSDMEKYKWAALNDYLIERVIKGKSFLNIKERKKVKINWNKVDLPDELIVYPSLGTITPGSNLVSRGKKINSQKDLH